LSETTQTVDRVPAGALLAPVLRRAQLAPRPAQASRSLASSVRRALQERRLFVLLPFAIIGGLMISLTTTASPEPLALATVAAAIGVALPLLSRSIRIIRLLTLLAAFWLGFCLLPLHGMLFGTDMLHWPAYGHYEARVDAVLSTTGERQRLVVSGIEPAAGERELPIRRGRIVVDGGPRLAAGDIVRAPIRFYPVPGPVVPGGFDPQFHSYFDGIGAYGSSTGTVELVDGDTAPTAERMIETVRRGIGARIDAVLQQPAAGIARALISGDQSGVSEDARDTMAKAGLAHVLSISGLHLTMVAGGAFFGLRLLLSLSDSIARQVSVKRLAAAGGIVAALAYFSISGGSVAATRATLMIILVFGAVILGRRALTMRNVAIAALVVILLDPASVFRPSFQLSFAAVVALIGAWELARSDRHRDRSIFRQVGGYFGGMAITSLVAGGATLLFSIYHFQQTSPLGVLGNLVSLPLVGFVMMPAAVFAALAMPFGLEAPLLSLMGWSIDRMLELAAMVAAWSSGFDASPLLTPLALVLAFAALGWFAFLPDRWRLLAPLLLLPAVPLLALDRPPDVLIADSSQAVAVRNTAGLQVVAGKAASFAVDVWRETYSEPMEAAEISCDSIACIGSGAPGFDFAIVKDAAGFYEECAADLVIARRDVPVSCTAGTVIDAGQLRRGGVHWLRWDIDRQAFEVRPAIVDLNRPWRAERW
jgi:competence protein ComEC